MPVQDVRLPHVPVKPVNGEVHNEARGDGGERAVDAARWGATLLTQLGLESPAHASKRQRRAA